MTGWLGAFRNTGAPDGHVLGLSERLVQNLAVEILRFSPGSAERIGWRPYDVRLASSIKLVEGGGEAKAYVIYLEPGGVIGQHEAGFGQIFLAVAGNGLVTVGTAGVSRWPKARPLSSLEESSTRKAATTG